MSSFDFKHIRELQPQKDYIWSAVEKWVDQHPEQASVPVVDLMSDLGQIIGASDLLGAINELIASGVAKRFYKVVEPSQKMLLNQSYNTRDEIPLRVLDNWDRWIEVRPQDVAMVLEPGRQPS